MVTHKWYTVFAGLFYKCSTCELSVSEAKACKKAVWESLCPGKPIRRHRWKVLFFNSIYVCRDCGRRLRFFESLSGDVWDSECSGVVQLPNPHVVPCKDPEGKGTEIGAV